MNLSLPFCALIRSLLAGVVAVAIVAVPLITLDPALHRLAHKIEWSGHSPAHQEGPKDSGHDPTSPTHVCAFTVFGGSLDQPVAEQVLAVPVEWTRLPHERASRDPHFSRHGYTRQARAPPILTY